MNANLTIKNRHWEIDFIRGIAIILMTIFHFVVDLKDFYGYTLDYLHGFWYLEGKLSAIIFILICGASSTLSKSSTRHGSKIFMWAMFLTVATYIFNSSCYILFGILHFLGISLLSVNFVKRLEIIYLAIISASSIVIGMMFSERLVTTPYLFPVGLINNNFISLDYYPLFPWYGLFILGIILGKILYPKAQLTRCYLPPNIEEITKPITTLGQHSLIIYLIHQPILLALLYIFHIII